ncbi:hypothetical protein PszF2a_13950 [Stutzerimonas stutzeri]|nr:hypothetical protein PszF2a_13950 [Stutzerimonas stutzeri]
MGRWLAIAGLLCSACYFALVWSLMGGRLAGLAGMPLNEIGDFLAGIFSPLAFLWLVLGFLQQGKELQASRHALVLQADELRSSVEQQKELVKVSREQHELELDARKAEQRRYEMSMQPVLDISRGLAVWSAGHLNIEFRLHNTGHQITRLELRRNTNASVSLPERIPVLGRDASYPFEVGARSDDVQNFILHIDFLDGLGQEKQTNFLFSRVESQSGPTFKVELIRGEVIVA